MPIKASSAKQIDLLIAELSTGRAVTRETAVARLTLIGARAIDRLTALVGSGAPTSARTAALRTLEGIGNPRGLKAALAAIADRDIVVAVAAISTTRAFLHGARSAEVVDHLAQTALDTHRHQDVRLAAIHALTDLEPGTLKPLWKALARDANLVVRSRAQAAGLRKTKARADLPDAIEAAVRGELPEPDGIQRAIAEAGHSTPLALLHQLLERIRERELAEPSSLRTDWRTVRAAAHLALANRGSRLGLYDLKEWLERTKGPLPMESLTALSLVGDASCLEALAAAYSDGGSRETQPHWWRQHLAVAFRAIAKREGITRRHAVAKRIARRWGDAVKELG